MNVIGALLLSMAAEAATPAQPPSSPSVRDVQRVEATVTIIAAESVNVRVQPQRGSSQATSRQYRERDKVPLVEFF